MSEADETRAIIKEITFPSGDFQLKGTLHLPANVASPPVVVGAHGLFSSAASPKQIALAERCVGLGIAYFRFDHRGCGESSGVFGDVTTLESRRKDVLGAIAAVRETGDVGNTLGLFGSSLGGSAVLSIALESGAGAIVTYAAPLSGTKIVQMLKREESEEIRPAIDPEVLHFDVSAKFEGITNILILHGDSDRIVSPSEAHRIYQNARMPKRLILLKNGDHAMSLPENQEKFAREAASWFKSALRP